MPTTGIQISAFPHAPVLTGTELVPVVTVGVISSITKAANAVITVNTSSSVNPFLAAQQVYFAGIGGMTQLNGQGAAIGAIGGVSGAWTLTVPIDSTGYGTYTSGGQVTATAYTLLSTFMRSGGAAYNATFQSGQVQWAGPGGLLTGDNNMIFGLSLPNPSGVNGPALLLGSGGGSGSAITCCIIQDQAFDDITPGNRLLVTSGETQPAGTADGGAYEDFGGASFGGTGGLRSIQGGTSANAGGGPTIVKGGAATGPTIAAVPGDTFIEGGDTGQVGASVHLIATVLGGVSGFLRHRFNSTITIDEYVDGSIFYYGGNGFGTAGAPLISGGPGAPAGWAAPGALLTATVPLAKITTGGAAGQIVFVNGLPQTAGYIAPT